MRISRRAFDRLVEQAIAELPPEFAEWLEEVPVIVEDRPGKADREHTTGVDAVSDEDDDDFVGLYVGRPMGEARESGELPPRVMIYREPLMDACATPEALAEEIRKTLLHELGHYAGMEEEDLEALGYGPVEEEDIEWDVEEDDDKLE